MTPYRGLKELALSGLFLYERFTEIAELDEPEFLSSGKRTFRNIKHLPALKFQSRLNLEEISWCWDGSYVNIICFRILRVKNVYCGLLSKKMKLVPLNWGEAQGMSTRIELLEALLNG